MKYKASAAYQRIGPLGDIINDTRYVTGEMFLDQASQEVAEAYVRAKARGRIIDEVVALHNYVPKSIARVEVEIEREAGDVRTK